MTGIIIGNGSIEDYSYYKKYTVQADLIICADGGANHALKLGIKPDLLMGDFDSISKDIMEYYIGLGIEIVKFPPKKDMTDTELAVNTAIQKGCDRIILIGCVGTRLDHSLANIFMLKTMLDKKISCIIANEYNEITLIKDKISLTREEGAKVTLLPLTERVEGVSTKGLYYQLDNATMGLGWTWGVSNEFSAETAEITIKSGMLLVIKSRD
mgnify:CR=1 FL=1